MNEGEQDYAPAISRDGTKVAYVRNTLTSDSRVGLGIFLTKCSIRVVNYDGTGDQEIASFGNQLWVSKLAWSPDDKQIAFDLAPRLVVNGLELQMGDPVRSEIHVMRLIDKATTLVIPAPAGFPTWSPLDGGPSKAPEINITLGAQLQFDITSLEPGMQVELESSSNLGDWALEQKFTASGNSHQLLIDPSLETKSLFFRIRAQ